MLADISMLLISTAFMIFMVAIIARFLAQLGRANFYNPLAQTVIKITNPVLVPLRKIIPGFGGLDIASLVLLYLSMIVFAVLVIFIKGGNPIAELPGIIVMSLLASAGIILEVLRWSMIIVAIASWVSSGQVNPMVEFVMQMIEPFVAPFRRLNLNIGMLDLSFLIAILAIVIIKDIILMTIAGNLAAQVGAGQWAGLLIGF